MKCKHCSHPFEAHTDRVIYPPCEGAIWPPRAGLHYAEEGRNKACFCRGFER